MRLLATLSLFLIAIGSQSLQAFPSNSRLGYASCNSCHVSPTGGGALNGYGRATAEDFLSTFKYENESKFLHGLFREDPPVITFGGDIRYISYTITPNDTSKEPIEQKFLMQRDIEFVLNIDSKLTLVTLVGLYGEDSDEPEYRRNYLLYNASENFSFRIGRFFPAFGILHEDHTVATRKNIGFDQGRESYNIELSARSEIGEIFLTGIFGNSGRTELDPEKGYQYSSEERGAAWRAAYYIGKGSQIGFSYLYSENNRDDTRKELFGPYAMIGFNKWAYAMAEIDWLGEGPKAAAGLPQRKIYSYAMLGAEIFRGIHIQGFAERKDEDDEFGAKLQLFPRPHFEFTASYETAKVGNTVTFLAHYYL